MAAIEEKDKFFQQLQATIDETPKRDIKIFMGDTNPKVSADNKKRTHYGQTRIKVKMRIKNFL